MNEQYIYLTDLPPGINEMVAPCLDGHTIYIDEKLSDAGRLEAYQHAMNHIACHDWDKTNVQDIESAAHNK